MKDSRLKVIFFGTPNFVVPILEVLTKNFEVVGVITSPDKTVGKKHILTPAPIKLASQGETLRGYNLKVFTPENMDQDFANKLKGLQADLFVMAAYGKIIPQNILDIPKYKALNIHPSLLPQYRGPSPIQSAILNGDKITGITIIKMDAKMDHGAIIYAEEYSISDLDNFQTLSTNMFLRSAEILPKIITEYVSGKLIPKPQDETKATYCKLITKEDGYFELPENEQITAAFLQKLDRMIRAYYPWPGAWTRFRQGSSGQARIVKLFPGGIIQMEGRKPATLSDFLHGYPTFPIKNFN